MTSQRVLGERILVWGGGGKSTLAVALSRKLGTPAIELDALFWLPGWVERDREEFKALVRRTVDDCGSAWIVDGQYTSVIGNELLARADVLVWLDLPWRVIFWRIVMRGFRRIKDKQRIVETTSRPGIRCSSSASRWCTGTSAAV